MLASAGSSVTSSGKMKYSLFQAGLQPGSIMNVQKCRFFFFGEYISQGWLDFLRHSGAATLLECSLYIVIDYLSTWKEKNEGALTTFIIIFLSCQCSILNNPNAKIIKVQIPTDCFSFCLVSPEEDFWCCCARETERAKGHEKKKNQAHVFWP